MKLKATDTIVIGQVGRFLRGEEFEVSEDRGKQLVARGLAVQVKSAKSPANKAAKKPTNKAS